MIKAILVDDEERGLMGLKKLIETYCPTIHVVDSLTNIHDAAVSIRQNKPDVVFLDIEMPGGNGFELLAQLEPVDFDIVFVTAYQEYAIKAIKFCAFEYLLKPVKIQEIQDVAAKLAKKHQPQSNERYQQLRKTVSGINPFSKIILPGHDGFYFVELEDIIYCKADDSYTHFVLSSGQKHIASKTLKEFEELFEQHNFFRIHKSFLVNLNHIAKVLKADGVSVRMSNGEELPVSFRRKDDFFKKLKEL